jgi:hypothetical protein
MTPRKLFVAPLGCWCALCIACASISGTIQAAPLAWTVTGTFSNGNSLSGSFNYDASTKTASNWNLTGAFNYTYTPADSLFQAGECCTDQVALIFTTFDSVLSLELAFNPNLTNSGGTSNIANGSSEVYQLTDRPPVLYIVTGGSATTGSVVPTPPTPQPPTPGPPTPEPPTPGPDAAPEPGTAPYIAGSLLLGLLGAVVRRRGRSSSQPAMV